ncbi:uncharacterized protein VICG_00397 [Vittaforma corneae ATCC 50505]|uniref:Uncharacterized protein n=1 Tax=Vittaforma corneae (strain ATCC 50505) TaxID=993615 RepID=L2GQ85_VITCO|nr:uncharacterized protein VICG_00397 [Vittaforma corneae ATCC 50505]ELA42645.1 hypothetical protein VICG_00397 [Vittaforma corneae ATCC 50505]
MKSIMSSTEFDEYKQMINEYLIDCCIHSDHAIRLQCLDIIRYLPIIFILRHDQHSLVKKKAYDIWKEAVFNTNRELKNIACDVLDFIKYRDVKVFCYALKGTISEICLKYLSCLEDYLKSCNDEGIKEFIYVEAVNNNKLVNLAAEFCKAHFCPELFNTLSKTPVLRDDIINNIDKSLLYGLCAENNELAFLLFNHTQDPVYIDLISTPQKLEIIKSHYQSHKTVSINDENVIFILQSIESCSATEDLLLRIHPTFSYYYISVHRVNCGALPKIFERVFSTCTNIDELMVDRNLNYIRSCSFEYVENKLKLMLLLISRPERAFFERVVELIKDTKFAFSIDQNSLYEILGYLFRNMLLANRRNSCAECISIIYKNHKNEMGYFKIIAENIVIKIK